MNARRNTGVTRALRGALAVPPLVAMTACGGLRDNALLRDTSPAPTETIARQRESTPIEREREGSTFFELFQNGDDPNTTVEVNRYIWNASLDVLNFLPVRAVDPFSGVITTSYGTPPGGGRAYRATIYVRDPALDARSLSLALATRAGPVAPGTVHAIEDAILTRARQLRLRDANL